MSDTNLTNQPAEPAGGDQSPNQGDVAKPKSLRPELTFSVLAVLISLLTLFVYIYQSNLMKTQQKMSVWPHLSFGPSAGQDYFRLILINKGVGPALVRDVKIKVNGLQLEGVEDIIPDSIDAPFSYSSIWPGQVIMAGEKLEVLATEDVRVVNHLFNLMKKDQLAVEICYCSVYDDCWTSYGMIVREGACR